jgi:hypothetical protein
VGDADVLRLGESAGPLLAYLRGETPAPADFDTSAKTGGTAPATTASTTP